MQDLTTRRFKPDENLIFHLIESQGSTQQTALRELVQNAYDAGATECHVTLTGQGFSVQDNGRGFGSEAEVEQFFETFGTPHQEAYGEKFGRFRMGRCQIMAFAATHWQSNEFQMEVDFKARGLDYDLRTGCPPVGGCHISGKWYTQVEEWEIEEMCDGLRDCFAFFYRLPVYLNGERISKPLSEFTISAENEDFYVIADTSRYGLAIYNLGIYVSELKVAQAGWYLTGMLLSKQHLRLDITRTHWLWQGTPEWERLDTLLRQHFPPIMGRGKLTSQQIQSVFHALKLNKVTIDAIRQLKLFHDPARTRFFTLADLADRPYSIVRPGDSAFLADKLNQWGKICALCPGDLHEVFSADTADKSLQKFLSTLDRQAAHPTEPTDGGGNCHGADLAGEIRRNYTSFDSVAESYQDITYFVSDKELSPQELCAIKALRLASERVLKKVRKYRSLAWVDAGGRYLEVGLATHGAAWTDGTSFICVHQRLLQRLHEGMRGADQLAAVLVHEWCHRKGNPTEHNAEFYRNYHDLVIHYDLALLTTLSLEINANYGRYLRGANLPVPVVVLKHMTGRAGMSSTQENQYSRLLNQFADLNEQVVALRKVFFKLLSYVVVPEQTPRQQVQYLLDSYEHLSEEDNFYGWLTDEKTGLPAEKSDKRFLNDDTDWTTLRPHVKRDFWLNVVRTLGKFRGKKPGARGK